MATGQLPYHLRLRGYTTPGPGALPAPAASSARAQARARLLAVLKANAGNAAFLAWPAGTPVALRGLVGALMQVEGGVRLGTGDDWREVLAHPFFECPGVDEWDLLDPPHPPLPSALTHIIDAATPAGLRGDKGGQAAYYSYTYQLRLQVGRATGVATHAIPTPAGGGQPVPALYVHLAVDEAIKVTSTVTGTTSPTWSQAFEFPLPLVLDPTQPGDVGQRVEGTAADWEELPVRLEMRHQVKAGAHAKAGEVLHVCVGFLECTVGQLLAMHRQALASAAGVVTRGASGSVVGWDAAGESGEGVGFALSLLSLEGVPAGELTVEVGVREEKRVVGERTEEERWEGGVVTAKAVFPGFDEWQGEGAMPPRGWEGRDRTGGKQQAGGEGERYVEALAPLAKSAKAAEGAGAVGAEGAHGTKRVKGAGGLDLDLSYVTRRLIACAIPRSDGVDPSHTAAAVSKYLGAKHPRHRVVRVLRKGEEGEDGEGVWRVNGDVFPLWQLMDWCAEVDEYLASDEAHTLCVQCDDGVHLSGYLLAAFLLFDHFAPDVDTAVKLFTRQRLLLGPDHRPPAVSTRQITSLEYLHRTVHGGLTACPEASRVVSVPMRLLHVRWAQGLGKGAYVRVETIGPVGYNVWDSREEEGGQGRGEGEGGWTVDVGVGGRVVAGDIRIGVWRRRAGLGLGKEGGQRDECVVDLYCHTSFVGNGYVRWAGKEVEGRWGRGPGHAAGGKGGVQEQAQGQQCEAFFAEVKG